MFLQTVLFDANGTLINKITTSKVNPFLTSGNFEKNYLATVDRIVALLNKKESKSNDGD